MVNLELGKEIKKDVFSSCHERSTKKKIWVPRGIEPQAFGFTISLISIYKHDAIDIADPSSMQDVYHHMNFVIDLAHRGVYVAQW